jgi:endonuclease/exonuclease/phosphatase family metal-dependent hydrolase
MPTIRLATFNCENLFARYDFKSAIQPPRDGFTINELSFDLYDTRAKRITAAAIKETDADIICLQEVDNQPVLDRFTSEFLGAPPARRYRHRVLIDGNDPRHIDIAFLSRYPITAIRTHRHERNPANNAPLFSRDCLRVEIDVAGHRLTLYGNHFKSMMGGRAATKARRMEQAEGVLAILERDWGANLDGDFAVLGDLNDYPGKDTDGTTTALSALLAHPELVDPVKKLTPKDRWTHYFARERSYKQLDYLLLSKSLAAKAHGGGKPGRVLQGLPWRADEVTVQRFPDVGEDAPKASDHVPLYIDLDVGPVVV